MATGTTFDVGQMRVHILDDGVFVTDAGNLFGGSRKASIKGAMHPVLVESGDNLVLIDAGFGPELPRDTGRPLRAEEGQEPSRPSRRRRLLSRGRNARHPLAPRRRPRRLGAWARRASPTPRSTCRRPRSRRRGRCRRRTDAGRPSLPSRRAWKMAGASCSTQTETFCPGSGSRSGRATPRGIRSCGSGRATTSRSTQGISRRPRSGSTPTSYAGVDTDPEAARQNRIEVLSAAESRGAPVILYHEPGIASSKSAVRGTASKPFRWEVGSSEYGGSSPHKSCRPV